MVEQRTENPCVGSSILPLGTSGTVAQGLEQAAHNRLVDGSNPSSPTSCRVLGFVRKCCVRKISGYRIAAIM